MIPHKIIQEFHEKIQNFKNRMKRVKNHYFEKWYHELTYQGFLTWHTIFK